MAMRLQMEEVTAVLVDDWDSLERFVNQRHGPRRDLSECERERIRGRRGRVLCVDLDATIAGQARLYTRCVTSHRGCRRCVCVRSCDSQRQGLEVDAGRWR
jgi:hypothetical protein